MKHSHKHQSRNTVLTGTATIALLALVGSGCGGEEIGDTTLSTTWVFESGDCVSTGVDTVRVAWALAGAAPEQAEFACPDGGGELGELAEDGGTYQITAEGLDGEGIARVESFGQSATFGQGRTAGPITITLRPKSADVVVSWNRCPSGVTLPYFIALDDPPAEVGGELTDKVTEQQQGCQAGSTTLMRVAPGDYIVEVDSRAVTPALRASAPVTVEPGVNAEVSVEFP